MPTKTAQTDSRDLAVDDSCDLAVDVDIVAPGWRDAVDDIEGTCRAAVVAAWRAADTDLARAVRRRAAEISVRLTDDDEIAALNLDYRQRPTATNVLSFPGVSAVSLADQPNGAPVLVGDVVMALGVLRAEAETEGKSAADHFRHLVVHGTLHLLGYDHVDDTDAEIMERLETEVLTRLGVSDPHATCDA